MKSLILSFLSLIFLTSTAFALTPEKRLSNEKQEQRAMKLFLEVRCLVCEGQVIESSNTEFSFQMRKLIRQKISEGQSDEKIKEYLKSDFGDDIIIKPELKGKGFLLWILPLIFGLIAGFYLIYKKK